MSTSAHEREIEVRFLEVEVAKLKMRLYSLGAQDLGEELVRETIFYGNGLTVENRKFVRLRQETRGVYLTYKHHQELSAAGTHEIEVLVSDYAKARQLLEAIGLTAYREQAKRRHSFRLAEACVDIVWWPKLPPLVEIEGPSEEALKEAAGKLGFDWSQAVFKDNRAVIEEQYGIPVSRFKFYTFDKQA